MVLVLGAGSGQRSGALKLGHFAALRWTTTTDGADNGACFDGANGAEPLAEVFVGGEGLARGPGEVLATLLHEAAHALADVRGIKDTSRQGRWHNAKFKALGEELGIEVTKDPRLGWSPTTLRPATRALYASMIDQLGSALRLHRAMEASGPATTTKKTGPSACMCGCPRRIRVAPSVLELGPIICGVCDRPFSHEADEHEADNCEDDNG